MAKAATGLSEERLPLICCAEGQGEVAGLRLGGGGGAEARWLSGFKVCWSSETAQRTEAFIISKVTGFSESNSGEK